MTTATNNSVQEMMAAQGLDWRVVQTGMVTAPVEIGGQAVRVTTNTHQINVRADNHAVLGVVGKGYRPLQNMDLARFADAIMAEGGSEMEACKIREVDGGRRVYIELYARSFMLPGNDEVTPFVLIGNGHDGSLSVMARMTSRRHVCNNTMPMIVLEGLEGIAKVRHRINWGTDIRLRHTGDLASKVEEARKVMEALTDRTRQFQTSAEALASRRMTAEEIQAFWVEAYQDTFGAIPAEPKDDKERKKREKAHEAVRSMSVRFNYEQRQLGTGSNAWLAMNAFTHWAQHTRKPKAANASKRVDVRYEQAANGIVHKANVAAMKRALALVG